MGSSEKSACIDFSSFKNVELKHISFNSEMMSYCLLYGPVQCICLMRVVFTLSDPNFGSDNNQNHFTDERDK